MVQSPDGGGLYFLPRRIGSVRAKELIFSARTVKQEEALAIGLADRLASGPLLDGAVAWAADLAVGPPAAIALAKSIVNRWMICRLKRYYRWGQAQSICYASDEHYERGECLFE